MSCFFMHIDTSIFTQNVCAIKYYCKLVTIYKLAIYTKDLITLNSIIKRDKIFSSNIFR